MRYTENGVVYKDAHNIPWYNYCFDNNWVRCRNSFCRTEYPADVRHLMKCPECHFDGLKLWKDQVNED